MERLAPKPVLDAVSQRTRNLLEMRVTPTGTLRPYIAPMINLRIRGLSPSLLYVCYTIQSPQWVLEPHYEVSAEETQTAWVIKAMERVRNMGSLERAERSTVEVGWCVWEDVFMDCGNSPLLGPSSYVDVMGNTQAHLLAYACVNRRFIDLTLFNEHFAVFKNHQSLQVANHLGMTPIKILLGNQALHEYAESLLLQLPPEKRLGSLPFNYWQDSWGTLMRETDLYHMADLIKATRSLPFFLNRFLKMTHNSDEAVRRLFAAGYNLYDHHLTDQSILSKNKQTIANAIRDHPSWHNLSYWLSIASDAISNEQFFRQYRGALQLRSNLIRDEILAIVFHPDRITHYVNMGYQMGEFSSIL